MLFSPPSILKETLPDDSGTGMDNMQTTPPSGTSHGSGMGYSGGKPSPKSKVHPNFEQKSDYNNDTILDHSNTVGAQNHNTSHLTSSKSEKFMFRFGMAPFSKVPFQTFGTKASVLTIQNQGLMKQFRSTCGTFQSFKNVNVTTLMFLCLVI